MVPLILTKELITIFQSQILAEEPANLSLSSYRIVPDYKHVFCPFFDHAQLNKNKNLIFSDLHQIGSLKAHRSGNLISFNLIKLLFKVLKYIINIYILQMLVLQIFHHLAQHFLLFDSSPMDSFFQLDRSLHVMICTCN